MMNVPEGHPLDAPDPIDDELEAIEDEPVTVQEGDPDTEARELDCGEGT